MANDLLAVLAVAIVGLAAVGSFFTPTGAIVGLHCRQEITPQGIGRMVCEETAVDREARPMFPRRDGEVKFDPLATQTHAKFAQKDRVSVEDTTTGSYRGPVHITGGSERMFSGENYVNRRRLQREKENT